MNRDRLFLSKFPGFIMFFYNFIDDTILILTTLHLYTFLRRWLLWFHQKAHHCRRLGMGLVAGNGRATPFTRGDDTQSHVRECRDSAGCAINCNRCRSMQNHEGTLNHASLALICQKQFDFALKRYTK